MIFNIVIDYKVRFTNKVSDDEISKAKVYMVQININCNLS